MRARSSSRRSRRYWPLIALRLDGDGARVISEGDVRGAGFTATGEVVFEIEENLTPGSDTPEFAYHLWSDRAGEQLSLIADARGCYNEASVSPSGRFAGWSCDSAIIIVSVDDGVPVLELRPQGYIAGFDAADRGVVVAWSREADAGYDLAFVGFDGSEHPLGGTDGNSGLRRYHFRP
jgi:hypothetical protein